MRFGTTGNLGEQIRFLRSRGADGNLHVSIAAQDLIGGQDGSELLMQVG